MRSELAASVETGLFLLTATVDDIWLRHRSPDRLWELLNITVYKVVVALFRKVHVVSGAFATVKQQKLALLHERVHIRELLGQQYSGSQHEVFYQSELRRIVRDMKLLKQQYFEQHREALVNELWSAWTARDFSNG